MILHLDLARRRRPLLFQTDTAVTVLVTFCYRNSIDTSHRVENQPWSHTALDEGQRFSVGVKDLSAD